MLRHEIRALPGQIFLMLRGENDRTVESNASQVVICQSIQDRRTACFRELVHLAGFGFQVFVEGYFEVEEFFALGVLDLVEVEQRSFERMG